jgi:hypothetical protein
MERSFARKRLPAASKASAPARASVGTTIAAEHNTVRIITSLIVLVGDTKYTTCDNLHKA